MSYFSDLDIAIQEKKQGKGRENISVNSVGVCLEDSGQPVKLYIVDSILPCGSLRVFYINGLYNQESRIVQACDFWALT